MSFATIFDDGRSAARRRELASWFALSGALHVGGAILVGTLDRTSVATPLTVIAVELVAAPPESSRAAPPPAPARREPKKVVLPKQARADPSKPQPAPPKPRPAPTPQAAEPAPKEYTDVLAQLRAEAGEIRPEARKPRRVAALTPSASATSSTVSPEVAAWIRRAKAHVRRSWVVPPGFRTQELETHVLVALDATGRVRGDPEITRRSGNPWYDDGVVRAIQKASPLPAPPEADRWPFVFLPEDSY